MERVIDGRYPILRELGSGGMGAVFEVSDPVSGRPLALKILTAEGERQRERLVRFRREFRAASLLVHPNIVKVHEFVSGRLSYYTMEYVEGLKVSAYFGLGERRLTPAELNHGERIRKLYSVLHQICLALGYIHSASIVHRDLKPENILVADAPAEGHTAPLVKVMDFGLARDLKETVALTQPGTVLGTLSYISPEQATSRAIDGRSDLYALGILLYLLLTGSVPFGTDTVSNILWKHCSEPPQPPRARNPGVNRFLESVCLRLLAKDPFDRFQSAAELVRLIEKAGRGSYPLPDVVRQHALKAEPGAGQVFVPRLIGRDAERARLAESIELAIEGTGSVVELVGAPGSGVSRLLGDGRERARARGAQVLKVVFDPFDPRPYAGFRPALEELVHTLGGLPDAEVLALVGPDGTRLIELDPVFADVRSLGRAAPVPERPPDPAAARAAFSELIDRLGRRGPVVLVIEHLESADELGRELLEQLAAAAARERGPDPFASEPGLVLWTSSLPPGSTLGARAERLTLPPLGLAHAALVLLSMLGHEIDDLGLAESLWLAAEGRPGEIEELVRLALAEGALRWEGARFTAQPARVQTFRARATRGQGAVLIRGAVRSRAESAGPTGQAMLRAMALLPRETSFEVQAGAAGLEEGPAIDAVEALLRARLIEEGQGAARLQVASRMVRDAVLEELDAATRAAIHRAALGALEKGPHGRRPPDPVLLLHHAVEGTDPPAIQRLQEDALRSLDCRGALATAQRWRDRLGSGFA